MINKSCPVSFISIDGNIARISAFYVGLLFITYLITMNIAIIYLLILDFTLKLLVNKNYSIILFISKKTKQILNIKTDLVDSAAKRLASFFALFFLITIAVLNMLELSTLLFIVSGILLACIAMEVTMSYCVGCEVYFLYRKFII